MSESQHTRNIVVLGGSYAGLSAAHYALKHTLPSLPKGDVPYKVILVNPSEHWYTRVPSPRSLVSDALNLDSKTFLSIPDGFKQYPAESFQFIQAAATSLDTSARVVTVSTKQGESTTVSYHALIIATGTQTVNPAFAVKVDEDHTKASLAEFRRRLPNAKSVVIAGGGPAGVETAGEVGEHYNGRAGFFSSKLANPQVKITLITGDSKLLPALRPAIAKTAEGYLAKVGVEVQYNVRFESVTPEGAGQEVPDPASKSEGPVTIQLSNGSTLEADVFIPATGVQPNTSWLPAELLTEKQYVDTNGKTLRVDAAGPRVYAVGDVGSYTRGGVMDIYDAIPVLGTNLQRDLAAVAASKEGAEVKPEGKDREYVPNLKETQVVPIGRSKGVGAVFGWRLPSIMVWLVKGRTFFVEASPAIVDGSKWNKESKWKPVDS